MPSWALIIPAGWVSQIWQALAFTGARPVGQTEWHWAAMQQVTDSVPGSSFLKISLLCAQGALQIVP